jgi:hypothetical protein
MPSFRRAALKHGLAILSHATNLTLNLNLGDSATLVMIRSGLAAIQPPPNKFLKNK